LSVSTSSLHEANILGHLFLPNHGGGVRRLAARSLRRLAVPGAMRGLPNLSRKRQIDPETGKPEADEEEWDAP